MCEYHSIGVANPPAEKFLRNFSLFCDGFLFCLRGSEPDSIVFVFGLIFFFCFLTYWNISNTVILNFFSECQLI